MDTPTLTLRLDESTNSLMAAARTLAYWVSDDDDLPADTPSEDEAREAVAAVYAAIARIEVIRCELAGQQRAFCD